MNKIPPVTLVAVSLIAFTLITPAQEWPRFHGPNGTGISHAKTIPTKISESDLNWKLDLPGSGKISVGEDLIF